jgi:predicted butyrate kinase (DUF1464 family)
MARVVGIDPGTFSFDLFGLEAGRPFLDESITSADVARSPERLVDRLTAALPLDLVVAPSGYGLPLVPIADVTDGHLDLLLLVTREDRDEAEMVGALRPIIELMRARHLPGVLVPGVIHLATVPSHRKVNRIDMGTADKVCAVALAIWDQARRLDVAPADTSLILVELGGAFTAGVAVDRGRIVDGIGGTSGGLGYRALGTLDGEVAYVLGRISKSTLFTGGAAFVAGDPELSAEALLSRAPSDRRAKLGWDAFSESVEKMVASLAVAVPRAREVLLSGRLSRITAVVESIATRLGSRASVRVLEGFRANAKEAAQGAALIADGLAGGPLRAVVEAMDLRGAHGTVLDHLYVSGAGSVRGQFGV